MRVANPKVNKEAVKTLVVLHGQREAARIAGLNENTVRSWAMRYGWSQAAAIDQVFDKRMQPICNQAPADAVAATLAEHKRKTKLHLAQYTVEASQEAAESDDKLGIAQEVRHVAAVASSVWPEERQGESGLTLNLLNLVMPAESACRSAHEDE